MVKKIAHFSGNSNHICTPAFLLILVSYYPILLFVKINFSRLLNSCFFIFLTFSICYQKFTASLSKLYLLTVCHIKASYSRLTGRLCNTFVRRKSTKCETYVDVSRVLSCYFMKQISCVSCCFTVEAVTLWNTKGFSCGEVDEITSLQTSRIKFCDKQQHII